MGFLHGFKKGFQGFGMRVNTAITLVTLLFVYIFGVGITSVIGKLAKKKFLDLGSERPSYWKVLEQKEQSVEDYKRSF